MQCPIDQTELVMTERQGVEIDYCPKCRGVWLDRGELDKIIERSSAFDSATDSGADADDSFLTRRVGDMQGRVQRMDSRPDRRYDDDDDDEWDRRKHKKSKRRNFFEDLFDFD